MRNRTLKTQLELMKSNTVTSAHIDGFEFVLDTGKDNFDPYSIEAIREAGFKCRSTGVKGFIDVEDPQGYSEYLKAKNG